MSAERQTFDRAGLASLDDLSAPDARALFAELAQAQSEFLEKESAFRGADYKWPRDPLRTWSRCWEYPYALDQLRRAFPSRQGKTLMDLGSGVTFLPFHLARQGFDVVCVDVDPVAERDLGRAARHVPAAPGSVAFRLTDGKRLPFDDGVVDAACCVSVLEHVPSPPALAGEVARVLKPGGLFVLTIDVDLTGRDQISAEGFSALQAELHRSFRWELPERTIHPRRVLTSNDGPYPMIAREEGLSQAARPFKELVKPFLGRPPYPPVDLCCYGCVLRRR